MLGIKLQPEKTNWYGIVATLKGEKEEAVENVQTENGKAVKFLQNGQLMIRYNGQVYTILGY